MRRRVLIVGEGRILYFLARAFRARKVEVAVLTPVARDAATLARRMDLLVVHGDPTQPRFLEEAGAGRSTDLVAAAEGDEDNLVVCQIAKKLFGVDRTIALVHDPDYVDVFRQLGVGAVISTTDLLARIVSDRTALEEFENLVPDADGSILVSDVVIGEGDFAAGRPLSELPLPSDCLVGGIVRGKGMVIPRGGSRLEVGDRAILLVTSESESAAIALLKTGPG